jgi:hypothetical protein
MDASHDPLYRFHRWQANLRILDMKEIKTVPYVPLSHPFVERLIGTVRRECLDRTLFWTRVRENTRREGCRGLRGREAVHRRSTAVDVAVNVPTTVKDCARQKPGYQP